MFATLEQITREEVEKLYELAKSANNRNYVDMHGIPTDSNNIVYTIALPIEGSRRSGDLEFRLRMLERVTHPKGNLHSRKHLEIERTDKGIYVRLHDDNGPGIPSPERFRYTINDEAVDFQDFFDARTLLVGYSHPASEGVSGILSIVIPPKQDSANGKVITFHYGDQNAAAQKGSLTPEEIKYETVLKNPNAALPLIDVAAVILGITQEEYAKNTWLGNAASIGSLERYAHFLAASGEGARLEGILLGLKSYENMGVDYKDAEILHKSVRSVLKLSRNEFREVLEGSNIFYGNTRARSAKLADVVRVLGGKGLLNEQNLQSLFKAAIIARTGQERGSNGAHPDNPGSRYQPDYSRLEPFQGVMLTDGDIAIFYTDKSTIYGFMRNSGIFTASYGITRAPLNGIVKKLAANNMLTSEIFEGILRTAEKRKDEIGRINEKVKGISVQNGDYLVDISEFDRIFPGSTGLYGDLAKNHPALFEQDGSITLENLVNVVKKRAEEYPADFQIRIADLELHLRYIEEFDKGLNAPQSGRPMPFRDTPSSATPIRYVGFDPNSNRLAEFLNGTYPANKVIGIFGYPSVREGNDQLREWQRRELLVSERGGNYSGENIIRRALQLGRDDIFRGFGYEGGKQDVLRAANSDFERLLTMDKPDSSSGKNGIEGTSNEYQSLVDYVRQQIPNDPVTPVIAEELYRRSEIDWNTAGQVLPEVVRRRLGIDVNADGAYKRLDKLVEIGAAVLDLETGYKKPTEFPFPVKFKIALQI